MKKETKRLSLQERVRYIRAVSYTHLIGENSKFAMTVNGMNLVETRGFYRLK